MRTREKQSSLVANGWVCVARCLGSVLGCIPDMKVLGPLAQKRTNNS